MEAIVCVIEGGPRVCEKGPYMVWEDPGIKGSPWDAEEYRSC